eukprot:264720-Prorocentrum_minimum.AAC.1
MLPALAPLVHFGPYIPHALMRLDQPQAERAVIGTRRCGRQPAGTNLGGGGPRKGGGAGGAKRGGGNVTHHCLSR